MNQIWEIFLEYASKSSAVRAKELAKKQFWMRPFTGPIIVAVTIVVPPRANPNLVRIARKLVEAMEGVLWERVSDVHEVYANLCRPSKATPTPRIVIKFWKRESVVGSKVQV